MPGTTSVSEWSEDGTEMEAIRAWYKVCSEVSVFSLIIQLLLSREWVHATIDGESS